MHPVAAKLLFAFIHGGQHTGACWRPTCEALQRLDSSLSTVCVDLPGRTPSDSAGNIRIADFVGSAVEQIEAVGHGSHIVLVGHSMAGITLPGVAARLGFDRVRRMIFVAACVPAQGRTVADTVPGPLQFFTRLTAGRRSVPPLPGWLARWAFGNGMSVAQQRFMTSVMSHECGSVTVESVDRTDLPAIPRDWVLTLRDRALSPKAQRRFIANLGSVEEVIALDTCHDAMISEPDKLASILLQRGLS